MITELTYFDVKEDTSDFEVVKVFIKESRPFLDPRLYRLIVSRGLYHIVHGLPADPAEALAVAAGRMIEEGRIGSDDPEIQSVSSMIDRLKVLKSEIDGVSITDVHELKTRLRAMLNICEEIAEWMD